MADDTLTNYQRGNRDDLISFAKWAQSMRKTCEEEAEQLRFKACENRSLARDNTRMSITTTCWDARCFKLTTTEQARRRISELLQIDPFENEEQINE